MQLLNISRKKDKENLPKQKFINEILNQMDNIKILGVTITDKLNWGDHVDNLAKRKGQRLGIKRKAKNLLPLNAAATLYKTKLRSVMEYCSPIWQSAPDTVLN